MPKFRIWEPSHYDQHVVIDAPTIGGALELAAAQFGYRGYTNMVTVNAFNDPSGKPLILIYENTWEE